ASADALRAGIAQAFPESPEAVALVFDAIRAGLAGSLHWVFLGAAMVLFAGLVAAAFMREVPLRGRGSPSSRERLEPRPSTSPVRSIA
ncbi:MAG TPA: hypothetical protein VFG86_09400, partial [Chloroflexota bacterium]|nr:hypothetical protein [Chloroflexota bacterium]